MELINYHFKEIKEFKEIYHHVYFTFENIAFKALVIEKPEKTYVSDAFIKIDHQQFENFYQVVDIPIFFGAGFSSYVYDFIYSNIQEQYQGEF